MEAVPTKLQTIPPQLFRLQFAAQQVNCAELDEVATVRSE
jgi:hypothetical protein